MINRVISVFVYTHRVPVVSDCSPVAGQSNGGTVRVAAGSSSNSMSAAAPARIPSPSPAGSGDNNTPVAENWCYTQVNNVKFCVSFMLNSVEKSSSNRNLIFFRLTKF